MFFVFLACLCPLAFASTAEKPLTLDSNSTKNYLSDLMKLGENSPYYCYYLEQPLTRDDITHHAFGRPTILKAIDEIKEILGFETDPTVGRMATRHAGFNVSEALSDVFAADQLYALSEENWKQILQEHYELKCDATEFRPTREDPRLRLLPHMSCNTMCRYCYPNSLPICLTRGIENDKQTCFCSYDAVTPVDNHVFQITN